MGDSDDIRRHLHPSDLRALAALASDGTTGVIGIVEGVHQSVLQALGGRPGPEPGRTTGLTGLVYRGVRGVSSGVGAVATSALTRVEPLLGAPADHDANSGQRDAFIAALNGVLGDRLASTGNPLATSMTLFQAGRRLDARRIAAMPADPAHWLLVLHGLCMNERQWRGRRDGRAVEYADTIAAAHGHLPIHLRYNSGLHISENARELALRLEQLLDDWPGPVSGISVLAHSMGGLLIRGAVAHARELDMVWPRRLGDIVFLGTPHHGAPLERAGNWVDATLGGSAFTAPFARLGQLRSPGITDLRHGDPLDGSVQAAVRFERRADPRRPLPLPEGVACFTVAATTASRQGSLTDRLLGDGLVPLESALGRHADRRFKLRFPASAQMVAYRTNHLELLNSDHVEQRLVRWFDPARRR